MTSAHSLRSFSSSSSATAARAVAKYYGRFPVDRVEIRIREVAGDRIGSGRTFGTRDGGVMSVVPRPLRTSIPSG